MLLKAEMEGFIVVIDIGAGVLDVITKVVDVTRSCCSRCCV